METEIKYDVQLNEREWALIRLLRTAGHGSIEAMDFNSDGPAIIRAGVQRIDLTDAKTRAKVITGRGPIANMEE